jgi:hypothetical protein
LKIVQAEIFAQIIDFKQLSIAIHARNRGRLIKEASPMELIDPSPSRRRIWAACLMASSENMRRHTSAFDRNAARCTGFKRGHERRNFGRLGKYLKSVEGVR